MKRLFLIPLLIIPLLSNAAWNTKVEDNIFDEKSALLIGEIRGVQSFMIFECKGDDLYLSHVEESNSTETKVRPVTLLFKVDDNKPIEFNAIFKRRNPNYVEAVTKDTDSIMNALHQLKSAKSKYMTGITVKGTDFRVSFTGDVYRSTISANSFMSACKINDPISNKSQVSKVSDCKDSISKSNVGKLTRVITNPSLLDEAICYNGGDVTQHIANVMKMNGDAGENLSVSSWRDNMTGKLYVSFFNTDTGNINLDVAYLDKNKKIKTTNNFLSLENDIPKRWPEAKFVFVGEAKDGNNRWLYFNVVEATNLYAYRLKLKDDLSPTEKADVEFFSNGGVYKIWKNGNLSVETSWIDDSKGRVLGGVIKDQSGKQVCELVTNDQEIPVEKQKCK